MRLTPLISSILFSITLVLLSFSSHAAMLGLCNDKNYTQYICCPENGGWIVSPDCNSGASPYCTNDTGVIANSTPPITILNDCKQRGGTAMQYPY